jgi:3-hydroxy acid dehydrogenase / malonic semialdehyde reductase
VQNIVFITGATSGFGKAMAVKFAQNGYNCIITGRRNQKLEDLKATLELEYTIHVLPLCFDVMNRDAVTQAISSLPAEWKNIDVLINNAGLAMGRDYFDEANLNDWETMIDTNIKGLLYVSKAVAPLMVERKSGHIINIGSIAGKEVYEKGNVYCATKAAVDALSQSMRIDMLKHGIRVTGIHPGAAETEFSMVRFNGDEATAKSVYAGIEPLVAENVAEITYYCTTLPPHVCINDLVVTCTQQANSFYINRK